MSESAANEREGATVGGRRFHYGTFDLDGLVAASRRLPGGGADWGPSALLDDGCYIGDDPVLWSLEDYPGDPREFLEGTAQGSAPGVDDIWDEDFGENPWTGDHYTTLVVPFTAYPWFDGADFFCHNPNVHTYPFPSWPREAFADLELADGSRIDARAPLDSPESAHWTRDPDSQSYPPQLCHHLSLEDGVLVVRPAVLVTLLEQIADDVAAEAGVAVFDVPSSHLGSVQDAFWSHLLSFGTREG